MGSFVAKAVVITCDDETQYDQMLAGIEAAQWYSNVQGDRGALTVTFDMNAPLG